jgi:hypothetical protein
MSGYRLVGGRASALFGAPGRDRTFVAPPPTTAIGFRASDLRRHAFPLGFVAVVLMFALLANLGASRVRTQLPARPANTLVSGPGRA